MHRLITWVPRAIVGLILEALRKLNELWPEAQVVAWFISLLPEELKQASSSKGKDDISTNLRRARDLTPWQMKRSGLVNCDCYTICSRAFCKSVVSHERRRNTVYIWIVLIHLGIVIRNTDQFQTEVPAVGVPPVVAYPACEHYYNRYYVICY
jgi:hypothetical protein